MVYLIKRIIMENKISQTALKNYDKCQWLAKLANVDHLANPAEDKTAFMKGKFFEYLVIGSTVDGVVPKLPPIKTGQSKDEKDIIELAEYAKDLLFKKMKLEIVKVQPKCEFNNCKAMPDLIGILNGKKYLCDLKFTETKENDSWGEWCWGKPEKIDMTQAIHYVYTYAMANEPLPFLYLVFGKTKWFKAIEVNVSDNTLMNHRERLQVYQYSVDEGLFLPCNDFSICNNCDYNSVCDKKKETPEIIMINL
jgi:CRISPR/Cas system-associated exonuclease Cas4 (RecB family)